MAHLEKQAAAKEAERLRVKVNLFRRLLGRGRDRKDIIHLFRFIDWLLVLPPELELESRRQITELQEGTVMPHIGGLERLIRDEGRAEGLREGLLEGLREAVELGLEIRFGKEALGVLSRVREVADLDRLRELKGALPRVATLAEFESLLGAS